MSTVFVRDFPDLALVLFVCLFACLRCCVMMDSGVVCVLDDDDEVEEVGVQHRDFRQQGNEGPATKMPKVLVDDDDDDDDDDDGDDVVEVSNTSDAEHLGHHGDPTRAAAQLTITCERCSKRVDAYTYDIHLEHHSQQLAQVRAHSQTDSIFTQLTRTHINVADQQCPLELLAFFHGDRSCIKRRCHTLNKCQAQRKVAVCQPLLATATLPLTLPR